MLQFVDQLVANFAFFAILCWKQTPAVSANNSDDRSEREPS